MIYIKVLLLINVSRQTIMNLPEINHCLNPHENKASSNNCDTIQYRMCGTFLWVYNWK
jgi:hypothetical protein